MDKIKLLVITLGISLFALSSAFAQSAQVKGVVLDRITNEPLIGVNVGIGGTTLGAATNLEGEFTINRVPEGTQTLIASSIGYNNYSEQIDVVAGREQEIKIYLEQVTVTGEAVIVSAQAQGQRSAINEQLSSNTITNVVSAERIQEIPDINAAESVGRLSGVSVVRSGGEGQKVTIRGLSPQFNVIMVNGVRMQSTDRNDRSVDLNMIAPNVLSGISVTKALTADMDADAVGGTVNLRIGKAREGFHSNFTIQNGYAPMAYTPTDRYGNYRISGLVTNRFLNNKLGVQVSGFLENQNRNADVLGAGYGINREDVTGDDGLFLLDLRSVSINDRVTNRQRSGGSLVLDYDLPNGSIIFNNFVSSLNQDQITQNNVFGTDLGWRGWATVGEFTNTVINNALQGEFDLGSSTLDFSLSNSVSLQNNPNDLRTDLRPRSGGTQGLSTDSTGLIRMSPNRFLSSVNVIERDKIVTGTSSLIRDVSDGAQAAALNYKVPFKFQSYLSGYIKVGTRLERNRRDNNEDVLFLDVDRGGLAGNFIELLRNGGWPELGLDPIDTWIPANLFRDPNYQLENFLSGNEGVDAERFYNLISIERMQTIERIAREEGYYLPDPLGSGQYDYNYTRYFQAYYAMAEIEVGQYITLQPGIRYEGFSFDYTADSTVVFGRLTTPGEDFFDSETVTTDQIDGQNWFPQLQVQIKPTEWFDLRLARTRSIIYPDYRAISPYLFMDTFGSTPRLDLGNPALDPSLSTNYDIYATIAQNHIGLLTAGYFVKDIDNFIVPVQYRTKDASVINNRRSLPQNTDPTIINTWTNLEEQSRVSGVEFEWQTNFWYLPDIFKGLVLSINYTRITSETQYPTYFTRRTGNPPFFRIEQVDTVRSGRLINQPNDILNVTVGYDIGGFSARLSYQYTDDILRGVNVNYFQGELDSYTAALPRWDFSARQELPWVEGLQLFMNINNITNAPDRVLQSPRGSMSNVEYFGLTASAGVRYQL